MKDIIRKLETVVLRRCDEEKIRSFSNIQVNYGVKKAKFSVKVAFDGCAFTGEGDTIHKGIQKALESAEDCGCLVMDKLGAQFHAFN